jgi:hypothetical protein
MFEAGVASSSFNVYMKCYENLTNGTKVIRQSRYMQIISYSHINQQQSYHFILEITQKQKNSSLLYFATK